MGISVEIHRLLSTVSRSNWNLEKLVYAMGENPEYPEKNPPSKDENQQQTRPTYDAGSENRTRATLVGGKQTRTQSLFIIDLCDFGVREDWILVDPLAFP